MTTNINNLLSTQLPQSMSLMASNQNAQTNQFNYSDSAKTLEALGAGMSIASKLTSIYNAYSASKDLKIQKQFLELQRIQNQIAAREQAVALRNQFNENLASAQASFTARGISMGSGIGRRLNITAQERLSRDLSAVQTGAKLRDLGILSKIIEVKKQRRLQYSSMLVNTGSAIFEGAMAYNKYKSFGGGK